MFALFPHTCRISLAAPCALRSVLCIAAAAHKQLLCVLLSVATMLRSVLAVPCISTSFCLVLLTSSTLFRSHEFTATTTTTSLYHL